MQLSDTEIELIAKDIQDNLKETGDVTRVSVVAAGGLIGWGLSSQAPGLGPTGILLLAVPVLAAGMEIVINRREHILQKATYLRAFAGDAYRWERALYELRHLGAARSRAARSYTLRLLAVSVTMLVVSLVLAGATLHRSMSTATEWCAGQRWPPAA